MSPDRLRIRTEILKNVTITGAPDHSATLPSTWMATN